MRCLREEKLRCPFKVGDVVRIVYPDEVDLCLRKYAGETGRLEQVAPSHCTVSLKRPYCELITIIPTFCLMSVFEMEVE